MTLMKRLHDYFRLKWAPNLPAYSAQVTHTHHIHCAAPYLGSPVRVCRPSLERYGIFHATDRSYLFNFDYDLTGYRFIRLVGLRGAVASELAVTR
jgi:hypothetical protein